MSEESVKSEEKLSGAFIFRHDNVKNRDDEQADKST